MKILGAKAREVRYKIDLDGVILYADTQFESGRNMVLDDIIRNEDGEKINIGEQSKSKILDFLSQNFVDHDVWDQI